MIEHIYILLCVLVDAAAAAKKMYCNVPYMFFHLNVAFISYITVYRTVQYTRRISITFCITGEYICIFVCARNILKVKNVFKCFSRS